jgi:hypothetical protein
MRALRCALTVTVNEGDPTEVFLWADAGDGPDAQGWLQSPVPEISIWYP